MPVCATYRFFTEKDYRESAFIIKQLEIKYGMEETALKLSKDFFPKMEAPVVKKNNDVDFIKWGFPIKNAKSVVFNARSETLADKPFFRKAISSGRCLIPSSGFYEWKNENGIKRKTLIRPADKDFFYMAGLYSSFIDEKNNQSNFFTIITSAANKQMSEIHNRMPVILTNGRENEWMDEPKPNELFIKDILIPYPKDLLINYLNLV